MGVRTLLMGLQDRSDGNRFEIWEEANGRIQCYQNASVMIASELNLGSGDSIKAIWKGSQAEYDAIAVPDDLVLYVIV